MRAQRSSLAYVYFALALSIAAVVRSPMSRADLPEGCTELGLGLTEHGCFHARFGPFDEVVATAGEATTPATPSIDAVHTHFRVSLVAGGGTVTYSPLRSGEWSIFHDPDVPLRVLSPSGEELPVVLDHTVESCPYLPRLRVHTLAAGAVYRYVFGPSTASEVIVLNEYVEDFLSVQSADADGDGYGAANAGEITSCVPPSGYVIGDSDCDDADPNVHPGRREICDGVDENCNLVVDDVGEICFSGSGPCRAQGAFQCLAPDAPVHCTAAALDVAEVEMCNAIDDDCDGTADDGADALCWTSPDRPRCVSSGSGKFCGCERDSDCGDAASGRLCYLRANEQRCVDGCILAPGRNGCPEGLLCTSSDPSSPGACTSMCSSDTDCAQLRGLPRCHFSAPSGPICVECVGDAHCADRMDGKTRCIGTASTCAQCNASDLSACDPGLTGGACLFDGRCGCNTDDDCSPARRCDTAASTCIARAAVHVPDASVETDASVDGSVVAPLEPPAVDAGDGDASDEPDAGRDDAIGADAAPERDAGAEQPGGAGDGADCGCHIVGAGRSDPTPLLGTGVLVVVLLARRRSAAWLGALVAAGVLLSACGRTYLAPCELEQSQGTAGQGHDPDHSHLDASVDHEHPWEDGADAGMDAAGPMLTSDSGRGGEDGSIDVDAIADAVTDASTDPPCVAQLGEALIAHSCQHVEVGPLVEVNAAVGGQARPDSVSTSHTAYAVRIAGAQGALSYRPSRQGMHVVMTLPPVEIAVFDSAGRREQPMLHAQPVDACPGALSYASVLELEAGRDYRLRLGAAEPLHLFIEHVDTFGSDAWVACDD